MLRRFRLVAALATFAALALTVPIEAQGPPESLQLRRLKGPLGDPAFRLTVVEGDFNIENLYHLFLGTDADGGASPAFSLYLPGEATLTGTDCDTAAEANQIRVDEGNALVSWCSGAGGWLTIGHGDGANCAAGEIPLGVDASGAVQGCYEPTEADITDLAHTTDASLLTSGTIPAARVGAAHVDALTELAGTLCGTSEILEDQGASWACIATPAGGGGSSISAGNSDVTVADPGAGTVTITVDASAQGVWAAGGLTIGAADATDQLVLPLSNDAVTPTIAFGDGDSGIYEGIDDSLRLAINGSNMWYFQSTSAGALGGSRRPVVTHVQSETTVPVHTFNDDQNTGMGSGSADTLSMIAGGVEVVRFNTAASAVNRVGVTPAAASADPVLAAAGTDTNIDLSLTGKGSGGVIVQGCINFGKLSAAPAGAACNIYYDTDINKYCFHNGTSWLQMDDSTTGCS